MTKTSRATEKTVDFEETAKISQTIKQLKSVGYYCIALEITSESSDLTVFQFPKQTAIALFIGAENFGVSDTVLNQVDAIIHIEMFGQNSSMNVVQATNIALYEMTKQLR